MNTTPDMPPFDLKDIMSKAQEMQRMMQDAQKQITLLEVEGQAGNGVIKVRMNGAHHIINVKISPTLMGGDEEMLEDLVAAAFNDATAKIEEVIKKKMADLAKQMKLPEGMGNPAGITGESGITS